MGGNVPLKIRRALLLPGVRHLAFRPYILLGMSSAGLIGSKAGHQVHLGLESPHKTHLAHKFHTALEAEGSVALVGIEMQLGRDAHTAQLSVNQCRTIGSIRVLATVVKAHRASLLVELEAIAQRHIGTVAFSGGGATVFAIGRHIRGSIDDGPIDMAGNVIEGINTIVRGSLLTSCKQ